MKYRIIIFLTVTSISGASLHARPLKWGYIQSRSGAGTGVHEKYLSEYTIISITGFRINRQGILKYRFTRQMKKIMEIWGKAGSDIFPLINFHSVTAGKRVLDSERLMEISARNIVKLLDRYTFKGIHIDFEYLPGKYSPSLGKFLRLLKMRMGNRQLTAALFPQVDFPIELSGFHKLPLLSPHLDQVVIMCYDLHSNRTGPGPVTGIEWAEKNIKYFAHFFPTDKIWLGIPGYGYRWINGKSGKAISSRSASAIAGSRTYRRHSSGTIDIQYRQGGREIWINYSDKKMRFLLTKLAKKYRLKGTALWRLGLEDR
jgi:spore germination protein YaaH